jgi:Uma2 family endonuclease
MSSPPSRHLVSEEEFLALPESMTKVELLDGEVVVAPSPFFRHQEILARLFVALRSWAGRQPRRITVGQTPMDIRFGEGRILQPDAFVILEAVPLDHQGPLARVPELCVEVLSVNRVYDRVTKRSVYAEAGVEEYWVVEAARYVERWTGPRLADREEVRDRLTSPLLPGFELDVGALFAE